MPLVIGKTVDAANETLAQQPLGSELIGVPPRPGKRPGFVIKQEPRTGFLSANGTVRLYVTRPDPRYGLLPNLIGSSVTVARSRLRSIKARTTITLREGPGGLGARAEAGRRRRCRARAEGHARRGPLTDAQRVPLTT